MDTIEIISWSAIGVFVLAAIYGFVRGMFKGAFRSLSDVLFVLVNAVASVLISKGIVKL